MLHKLLMWAPVTIHISLPHPMIHFLLPWKNLTAVVFRLTGAVMWLLRFTTGVLSQDKSYNQGLKNKVRPILCVCG